MIELPRQGQLPAGAPDEPLAAQQKNPSGRYLQKREMILNAAARKFNTLGVHGATLDDIAGDVGMNLTSIRHYFRRKDDLVAEGYLRSLAIHEQRLSVALDAGLDRETRVRALVAAYFDLRRSIREGTGPEIMIFGDLRSLSEEHAAVVWPRYVALIEIVRRAVSDPYEIITDRRRVNARAYHVAWQLFRSVFWLSSYPVDAFDWVQQKFLDILLNGVAARGVEPAAQPLGVSLAPPAGSSWENVLVAATRLINEQGYRGASVEAIAREFKRTKGSFYHHVEGKDDLLKACFNRSVGVLRDAQREVIASRLSGLDQTFSVVSELMQRQQTALGPLLRTSALMSAEPAMLQYMRDEMAQVVLRFSAMVTDGIIDGSLRACDPRLAGEMMLVTVNSASQIHNWTRSVTPENIVEYYALPLFKGILA